MNIAPKPAPPAHSTGARERIQGSPIVALPVAGSGVSAQPVAPSTQSARVLDAIIELGQMARPDQGMSEYLDRVATVVCRALDYRVCVVYLYDRFDDAFYAEATCGVDK